MINFEQLPWLYILAGATLFPGVLLIIILGISKYPAMRILSKFLMAELLLVILYFWPQGQVFQWTVLSFMGAFFLQYSEKFFSQRSGLNFSYFVLPIFFGVISFVPYPAYIEFWLFGVLIIQMVLYVILSFRNLKNQGSLRGISWFQNPGSRLLWFRNFILLSSIQILFISIASFWLNQLFVSLNLLFTLVLVFFQLIKESKFLAPIQLGNKYQKSTLTADQKYAIVNKLDKLINTEKFYLQDDVSLSGLAKTLNTTTHHLSQVINETKGITFQKLISQYRIREAKVLLKDESLNQLTIENIAEKVGYNSKSSFNTAFKRYAGLTPTEYKEQPTVRTYREERLPDRENMNFSNFFGSLNHNSSPKFFMIMVTNFLKLFFRTLSKNKLFSMINFIGLTVGFTSSILIYLFIQSQLSFDKSIKDSESIYRVVWTSDNSQTRTPHPMAQGLAENFSEVTSAVSFSPWFGEGLNKQDHTVEYKEKDIKFAEPDIFFADSTFFDVFGIEVIAGDKNALSKPWSLVITKQLAEKYFGDSDPVGKTLLIDEMEMNVSAVVKAFPKNTHFHFQALLSYVSLKQLNPSNEWFTWNDFGHYNYIKTNGNISKDELESKIKDWVIPHLNWEGVSKELFLKDAMRFELQPLEDIHLHSQIRWELESNGNSLYVNILWGTLFFILIIIVINYINLTIAKSVDRAKEIGIRKTLGAEPFTLVTQFYLEAFLFCFVALIFSLFFGALLLNIFNNVTGSILESTDIFNFGFLLKVLIVCLVISFVSGFYPSFLLTSYKLTAVLKGKFATSIQGNRLRSTLVFVQFFVSAILITGSLMIMNQVNFMRTKDLGFNQEAVVSLKVFQSVEYGGLDMEKIKTLHTEIGKINGVKITSGASNVPGDQFDQNPIYLEDKPTNRIDASEWLVDFNIEEALDLTIVAGRKFNIESSGDLEGTNFIINETAAQQLGLNNEVGKSLIWEDDNKLKGTIIGIVKDFNFQSLKSKIDPLIIKVDPPGINRILIKFDGDNFQETLNEIKLVHNRVQENTEFDFQFLDERLAGLYQSEVKTLTIFSVFTAIALFLSCLGLLGTAMAIINQKVKEIGIRKIMGANSIQMTVMVLKQFLKLVIMALIFAIPVSYLLSEQWLMEFSYKVNMGVLPYLIAALILIVVAMGSIAGIAVKVAFKNPVDTLKYE